MCCINDGIEKGVNAVASTILGGDRVRGPITNSALADSRCGRSPMGRRCVLDCRLPMGHTYQFTWAWPLILDFFDAWP